MAREYGKPLLAVTVMTLGALFVIAAVTQVSASWGLRAPLLAVGVIVIVVGVGIVLRREGEPEPELPPGSFLVKTKHSEVSVPDAGEAYRKGVSVWVQRWWRPGKPEIIRTEQVKRENAELDVIELRELLHQGKGLNTRLTIVTWTPSAYRTRDIERWRTVVVAALAPRADLLRQFKTAAEPPHAKDPELEVLRVQIGILQGIVDELSYWPPGSRGGET
ncbi:MAG: hypothetical protein ABSC31_09830 [Acidimicrobiales bacterium]